jgi:hypothetical protein
MIQRLVWSLRIHCFNYSLLQTKKWFWTFNLSFDILATVLATFSNVSQIFINFLVTLGVKSFHMLNVFEHSKV